MSIFNLEGIDNKQAKYLQLVDVVRMAVKSGQLVAGDPIPSVKVLSETLNFNRHTIMKAFAELIAQGWIESKQRVGYQVAFDLPIESSQDATRTLCKDNTSFQYRLVRSAADVQKKQAASYQYNFSGGYPDMSLFPFREFKRCMSEVLSRPNVNEFGYGDSAGTPDLITQVEVYLRRARAITDRKILITNGSQEAMFITAQLLLQAGDEVAIEALGYPPAMQAFENAGATLVSIKRDNQGLVPEDLADKINQGNIRLIYLTPLHHYPTTVTLTISRRMKVYKLAAKHGIPIIEDDYDHEFHYRCQPLAPMVSQDPKQLVIYVSTFSKIMFPGARIGFMAVNSTFAKAVENYRLLISHKSNVLMQAALAKWMQTGGFERHLRRVTRLYQQRRDHAIALLNKLALFDFTEPDGGMALWLRIKNNRTKARELSRLAKQAGIYLQHEGEFHLINANNKDEYIRIGFAGMNEARFAEGVEKLVELM